MYGSPGASPPPPPAFAVLRSELAGGPVPEAFRLIPAGEFRAPDGRPAEVAQWEMTDADGRRIVAEFAARHNDGYIDYEHATLLAKKTGQPAPAAGWYAALEWRPGDGLWATGVQWVAAAAALIRERAYRYISPLFSYDVTTGRVLQLLGASLTNDPGLDGLTDLAALAAQLFQPLTKEPPKMAFPKLFAALALAATATDDEAFAAVETLKTQCAALSARIEAPPDPSKYVPIGTLAALQADHARVQGELAALNGQAHRAKVEAEITAARAAGKLAPALEAWARKLGESNLAALTAYLKDAPVVAAPGSTQTGGKTPEGAQQSAGGLDRNDAQKIAEAALAYQIAQAKNGVEISTPAAVAHVLQSNQGD